MNRLLFAAVVWAGLSSLSQAVVATLGNFQSLAPGPTEYEQYLLELLNRARAAPDAEVARLSSLTWGNTGSPAAASLNEGLAAGTITSAAKQPLAFNPQLIEIARDHVAWSFLSESFAHNEGTFAAGVNWTGNTPQDRATNAGYTGWRGENIGVGVSGSTTAFTSTTSITSAAEARHNSLFIDQNVGGRGHRLNFMDASFTEVGVGFFTDSTYQGNFSTSWNRANMANYDFGSAATLILTGVVYQDLDDNAFYTPDQGEALGGIIVNAYQNGVLAGTTTTWGSGGYSLTGMGAGTYDVEFVDSSGNVVSGGQVLLAGQNVKLDLIDPAFIPEPHSAALILIGVGLCVCRRRP